MGLRTELHALHRRAVDPGEHGPGLGIVRAVLTAASVPYGLAVRARNRAYDQGRREVRRATVPVISVGNLTAGGTGKTPMVAWLAEQLKDRCRVAILSQGYGRDKRSGVDDENLMLARMAPDAALVVNADRVAGAEEAVGVHGAEVLILDDGFQHRRLARDLDIVLVDAVQPFGGGRLLPRGLLREPPGELKRADFIVLTRSDLVGPGRIGRIRGEFRRYAGGVPIALAEHRPTGLRRVDAAGDAEGDVALEGDAPAEGGVPLGGDIPLRGLREGRWAAFCGIGNPEGFRRTLEQLGAQLVRFDGFPDHYRYAEAELRELVERAAAAGCEGVLTTEKDATKVGRLLAGQRLIPVLALRVGMEIVRNADRLQCRIRSAVGGPD